MCWKKTQVNYTLIMVICLTDEERFHLWFQASEEEKGKTTNNKLLGKDSLRAGKFPHLATFCEIQPAKYGTVLAERC